MVAAAKSGRWVLLRNVHLCASWLVTLEKRLHALKPHANFRLFLTSEIHPQLPVGRRCCWTVRWRLAGLC